MIFAICQVSHIYICDHHKTVIQSVRKRKRKDSEDDRNSPDADDDVPEVGNTARVVSE